MEAVGLFAGIGGIEQGFERAGVETRLLCEIDPYASAVLRARFPEPQLVGDVRSIRSIPAVDILAAGFPCQDLSQAGRTGGITGSRSGLVSEVFRLLEQADPRWLVLENVPFMLQLERGRAMGVLTETLSSLGYEWAYRIVDTRSFGLPQRRRRVVLVASRTDDPCRVLFADDAGEPEEPADPRAFGFYWTEGLRGVGWAVEAIPTLKNGSTVGIPSPPAVWLPESGELGTPSIRDAERLQGFDPDWTTPASAAGSKGERQRWSLVGNAVSVPMAEWLGGRLVEPGECVTADAEDVSTGKSWPAAAASRNGRPVRIACSEFPLPTAPCPLSEFLEDDLKPLSARAASGFLSRARRGNLRFEPGFLEALDEHVRCQLGDVLLV